MDPLHFESARLLLGLTAVMSLTPAGLLPWRQAGGAWLYWALHLVALAGCGAALALELSLGWTPRLALALWLSLAVVLAFFPLVAWRWRGATALAPLLYPYLLLLALGATLLPAAEPSRGFVHLPPWLSLHIVFALAAYGLVSLAGLAALAVAVQEQALKRRRPDPWSLRLPALAEAERLQVGLLAWAEALLAAAIASGMAHDWTSSGRLMHFDHKTVLALAAFAVIGLLLLLAWQRGLRGRRAARVVLLAYLLLSLAYPGVKFVGALLVG